MIWPVSAPVERIAADRDVDPYAVWAAATSGAYLSSHTADRCRLALELRSGFTVADLIKVPGLLVPGVYRDRARFCSAEMSTKDSADWLRLQELAYVALAEPGMARPDDGVQTLDTIGQRVEVEKPSGPTAGRRVVIGVIDGACGFANRQFRRRRPGNGGSWQTRLTALWDQGADADRSTDAWIRPPELGYGCELQIDKFNALLVQHLDHEPDEDDGAQAFGERSIYRALGVALPVASDWSHGTHVLDAAGGWPPRFGPPPVPTANVDKADLIVVQLPQVALRDTSGRWMPALVLDGLRYIVERAGPGAEIVVNLSLGAFAGPHDGSSMLEQAIDALIDDLKGRLTVVVAAGNAASPRNDGDGTRRHCHAETLLKPGSEATLSLDIDPADATETFVELWLPDGGGVGQAAPKVMLDLVPPDGHPPLRAPSGSAATWRREPGGMALAQVVNLSGRSGKGPRGAMPMMLVAIGTTRDLAGYRAPRGRWRIVVRPEVSRPVLLKAWVERRDVPGELAGERPQYGFAVERVVERPREAPRFVSVDADVSLPATDTLGSVANGEKTISVAGAEFPDGEAPRISPVSSQGPAARPGTAEVRPPRGNGPLVAAPCEFAAAGFLTGSHKTLKGTSMSAAWVTRLVAAELIAHGAPAAGVRTWLLNLVLSLSLIRISPADLYRNR